MSARSFRSVFMVASCAGAALGCYLVSLRVASERAALKSVETRIVLAQRDLRVLQTEIGTRGRLAQLERWNAKVLALSAPSADQFLNGTFELARLARPEHQVDFEAPVVLASAPTNSPRQAPIGEADDRSTRDAGTSPRALLREASLKTETREVPARPVAAMPRQSGPKSADRPVTAAKPVPKQFADRPGLAAAKSPPRRTDRQPDAQKSVDKPVAAAAGSVTKPVQLAKADPLAPLADKRSTPPSKDLPQAQ